MRFRAKLIFAVVIILAGWLASARVLEFLKEKYIYEFAANRICVYAERRWGAELHIGCAKGSIFRDLYLENIFVNRIKNLPEGLRIKADSLDIAYPPLGLLFGRFDAACQNLRLIYKGIIIPLSAYQREGLAVISARRSSVNLSELSDILPKGFLLSGTLNGECEVILKKLTPHLINASIDSKDLQLECKPFRAVRAAIKIEAAGKANAPHIYGDIKIYRADVGGGLSFLSFLKTSKTRSGFFGRASLDIGVNGENITLANKHLSVNLGGSLRIKKDSGGEPYLLGRCDITNGSFKFYEAQFRAIRGSINFGSFDIDPTVDMAGEAAMGRYKVSVSIHCDKKARAVLHAKPELPDSEIVSLLMFGKRIDRLTSREKERLSQADINGMFTGALFAD